MLVLLPLLRFRVFSIVAISGPIGHTPYRICSMQLAWLCFVLFCFGGGGGGGFSAQGCFMPGVGQCPMLNPTATWKGKPEDQASRSHWRVHEMRGNCTLLSGTTSLEQAACICRAVWYFVPVVLQHHPTPAGRCSSLSYAHGHTSSFMMYSTRLSSSVEVVCWWYLCHKLSSPTLWKLLVCSIWSTLHQCMWCNHCGSAYGLEGGREIAVSVDCSWQLKQSKLFWAAASLRSNTGDDNNHSLGLGRALHHCCRFLIGWGKVWVSELITLLVLSYIFRSCCFPL